MSPTADPTLARPPQPGPTRPLATLGPRRLIRQMFVDSIANWAILIGAALVLARSFTNASGWTDFWLAVTVLVVGLLATMFLASVRAYRELPYLTLMLDQDPVAAERRITALSGRLPMLAWVRALLYHRLTVLRYRQQRFAEAIDLADALLAQRLGRAAQVRSDLLLMLVDSHLRRSDLWGAYYGLTDLSHCRLALDEHVQRLALDTRYKVAAGYHRLALANLERKLDLVELLPSAQCAALHLVLAAAARRLDQLALADWLDARAKVLGAPLA